MTFLLKKYILTIAILFFNIIEISANLEIASPFTSKMVLQRNMELPIWGEANPNIQVTIKFNGGSYSTKTDSTGKWKVNLPPIAASNKGQEMTISTESKTITLSDILVGEVWICSGQSNMQMPIASVKKLIPLKDHSINIRSFEVTRTVSFTEETKCIGEWKISPPNSAVAFSFAYHLQKEANVPIGIILTCWGSSSLEAWMPREMVSTVPHFKTIMEDFDKDTRTKSIITNTLKKDLKWSKPEDVFLRRQPNILFNAMINPLIPFACRGVIWYQGERNTQSMDGMVTNPWYKKNSGMMKYGTSLQEWIKCYRTRWGKDDLHFIITMLPGYGATLPTHRETSATHPAAHSWAWIREAQLSALQLEKTSVSNNIDLGNIKDIHPKDKLPVGHRIALLAARDTLNQDIKAHGPIFKEAKFSENSVTIYFNFAEGLSTKDNKPPNAFWISNNGKDWHRATAEIVNNTVVLTSEKIKLPKFVRYAFAGKPEVNLINSAKLPAYPFRTDQIAP